MKLMNMYLLPVEKYIIHLTRCGIDFNDIPNTKETRERICGYNNIAYAWNTYVYTYIHMYRGYGISTLKENILSLITFALYMLTETSEKIQESTFSLTKKIDTMVNFSTHLSLGDNNVQRVTMVELIIMLLLSSTGVGLYSLLSLCSAMILFRYIAQIICKSNRWLWKQKPKK